MRFDWTRFDDPILFLDQVMVPWYEEPACEFGQHGTINALSHFEGHTTTVEPVHGTILRMHDLNSNWQEAEFEQLKAGLSRLVSPFSGWQRGDGNRLSDDFDVRLEVPEPFAHFSGVVGPPDTLENSHYALQGQVDKYGGYDATIRLRGQENVERVRKSPLLERIPTACGPFTIHLSIWDRDPTSMGDLAKARRTTIRDVRRDLDAMAGISVYRDGFRVLPYGERDDDWLRLDLRRVQNPTLRLSNNQIVGFVLIGSDTNPLLKDQTNREGLVSGSALNELRFKITELLNVIEPRRYTRRGVERQSKGHGGGIFTEFGLGDISTYVSNRYPENVELIELVRDKASDLHRRVEEVQEVLARYHRLATLGYLVDTVLHDGRTPLSKIAQAAFMARRDARKTQQHSTLPTERLEERLDMISAQAEALASLFRRIEPFGGRRRGRPARLEIEQIIKDGFGVLSSKTLDLGVTVDLPTSSNYVTVESSDIQEIIVNLLENSLYWLQQVKRKHRYVIVTIKKNEPSELQIVFSDSGPGIDNQFVNNIFDPYFSTKPNGIGLGLAIAGGIVNDYYDGDLELLKAGPLTGATFRITLRRRV